MKETLNNTIGSSEWSPIPGLIASVAIRPITGVVKVWIAAVLLL